MDWHELEKLKVTELREMAKEKLEIKGVSGMAKAMLVETLAKVMDIEKPHKVAEGAGKSEIKKQIHALKIQRDEALAGKDKQSLKVARHKIHRLRRQLRRMAKVHG